MRKICSTCGNKQGPFQYQGDGVYICTPVVLKENKLVGRVLECNERRKKLELEWYGPEHREVELFKTTRE